jgi:hypothetical protein
MRWAMEWRGGIGKSTCAIWRSMTSRSPVDGRRLPRMRWPAPVTTKAHPPMRVAVCTLIALSSPRSSTDV